MALEHENKPAELAVNSNAAAHEDLIIGVLALQGAFAEHCKMIRRLGAQAIEVRRPEELDGLDGLIIPGGESTTMGLVAQRWGVVEPLRQWVHAGKPTFGTCAGMILLAERATNQKQGGQPLLGGLDVTVNRNFFGRQVDSFETWLTVARLDDAALADIGLNEGPCHAVFIRAPAITEVGPAVDVLAQLAVTEHSRDGEPQQESVAVAVRNGMILATAFHPELTSDLRWHRLFLEMARQYNKKAQSADAAAR